MWAMHRFWTAGVLARHRWRGRAPLRVRAANRGNHGAAHELSAPEMAYRTPPWLMDWFDRTLRGVLYDADRVVGPHVRASDRVADIGCGAGFYSVALSRLVGERGEVVLLDAQRSMLDRAVAHCEADPGATARLTPLRADGAELPIDGRLDFALLSWMLHEVDDARTLWARLAELLAPGGRALVIEPRLHVSRARYERELAPAIELGLARQDVSGIFFSRAALLCARGRTPNARIPER